MRTPIRWKLAAALAMPLTALVAVASVEIARADARADDVAEIRSRTELAAVAVGPGSLLGALQDERNFTSVDLIGLTGALDLPVASYEEARQATDRAVAALRQQVTGRRDRIADVYGSSIATITEGVASVRADVDSSTGRRDLANAPFANEAFDRYTTLVQTLMDGTTGIALDVDDATLRTGIELVDLATLNYETAARIVRSILLPELTATTSLDTRLATSALVTDWTEQHAAMIDRSIGPYEGIPESIVDNETTSGELAAFEAYVDTGHADLAELVGVVSSTDEDGSVRLRARVADVLDREVAAIADRSERDRSIVIGLVGTLLVVAVAASVAASRSITEPLRSLTRQARRLAGTTLPEALQDILESSAEGTSTFPGLTPVVVTSHDEVGDVAATLNTAQSRVLDLAMAQVELRRSIAKSFVSLGRRNQNLLDRQLDLISRLEQEEANPDRLHELFRLDHLATRMRRNAESLVRLAGGRAGGTDDPDTPVAMVDIVRGALGEVEGFERVEVRTVQAATVDGAAAADLSHALAELVENALQFSPPDESVQIRGRFDPDGGYVLAMVDEGVGMGADQLEIANRRLAGEESFTVAPSRYLGHYVAGYLASSHDIRISLEQEPLTGTTVRIDVPAHLVERGGSRDWVGTATATTTAATEGGDQR